MNHEEQQLSEQVYGKTQFDVAECAHLTAKQLMALASYDPIISTPLSEQLKQFLRGRAIRPVDKTFFFNLSTDVMTGRTSKVGSFEEQVYPKGGEVIYSEKSIDLLYRNGTTAQIPNRLLPTVVTGQEREDHDVLLTVTCAVFDITAGKLEQITNQQGWRNMFSNISSAINFAGIPVCRAATEAVCKTHPTWTVFATQMKTLHGPQFYQFFSEALKHCSWTMYLMVHDAWARNFFKYAKVVDAEGGGKKFVRQNRVDEHGQTVNILPKESVVMIGKKNLQPEPAKAWQTIKDKSGLSPLMLRGPFPTTQLTPSSKLKPIDRAYKSWNMGNLFRGGSKRGIGAMAAGIGFSGMQSANSRRLCSLLSAALELLAMKRKVQIHCQISDVVTLNSSIRNFMGPADFSLKVSVDEYHKLIGQERHLAVTTIDEKAVAVKFEEAPIPAPSNTVDFESYFDKEGQELFDRVTRGCKSYVVFLPVLTRKIFEQHSVYAFKAPYDFSAIVTNVTDFVGRCVSRDKIQLERVKLLKFETFEGFCEQVVIANQGVNQLPFLGKAPWNPVSNLICPPRKGYEAVLTDEGVLQWDMVLPVAQYFPKEFRRTEEDELEETSLGGRQQEIPDVKVSAVFPDVPPVSSSATTTASPSTAITTTTTIPKNSVEPKREEVKVVEPEKKKVKLEEVEQKAENMGDELEETSLDQIKAFENLSG